MNKSNRPVIVYGNDFSLNISVKRYDAQTDDYIDLDLSQVTDLEVYLTCSNNNTTIPLDFTTSGSFIKCQVQYRFLAPQTSYGIVVEAFDEENKHFRFEALPREGFLVVSNTSGYKPAENVDVIDIKARIGWGNTVDAYTKEEMDTKLEDYYDKEAVDSIVDPISERLSDAEGTLNDHTTQIDDIDNNVAINTDDIATNKTNIAKNTRDIIALNDAVENKQDTLVSGKNIKTVNGKSIVGQGNVIVGGADYSKEYFTIESLADRNTITFVAKNDNVLSYTTDEGITWTNGREVTVNKGEKVWWKGNDLGCNYDGPGRFNATDNFKVYGNIMSLEFGDNFAGQTTITKLYQFAKLFTQCTKIVDAKDLILPATTLSNLCYLYMFYDCTALVGAPELPATILKPSCYTGMFSGCTKLTKAPELPATRLESSCYTGMFQDCTSLTKAPELPATTLISNCYTSMFRGCTGLTEAPVLPAPKLENVCYTTMFQNCTKLSYVKMLATDNVDSTILKDWLDNVSERGTMITSGKVTLTKDSSDGIPTGWTELQYTDQGALAAKQDVLVSGTNIKTINNESILGEGNIIIEGGGGSSEEIDYSKEYLTIESLEDSNSIGWKISGSSNAKTISVSTDNGATWQEKTSSTDGTELAVLNKGDKLLIKATNNSYYDYNVYNYFTSTNKFNVSGNIMSLLYGDNFEEQTTFNELNTFTRLFSGCTGLVSANNLILPASKLTTNCYSRMFQGCTSLIKAPELPATTLENSCYYFMFQGCTSLIKAPELPATTLANYCYGSMFANCTSLTKAPELPAATLAPSCYKEMFQLCSKLQYIKILATDVSAENCLMSWINFVGKNGIMITSGKVTIGIPTGWTELSYVGNASLTSNLKTINNQSIVGSGNITIEGGGGSSEPVDYSKEYFTIESLADNNTITFTPYSTNTLSYSTDNGTTWTEGNEVTVANGDKVLWKGSNLVTAINNGCGQFGTTSTIKVYGNIMSLIFSDEFVGKTAITKQYQFVRLFNTDSFKGCPIIDASNLILPATTLSTRCYYMMFKYCTLLKKSPKLPAKTLSQSCYELMFQNCTSLVEAPELPATTLAARCYASMFDTCTSLTKAPELPATSLTTECYSSMFTECVSLVEAPELPATTLTERCYASMFYRCVNLHFVKMLATDISASSCLTSWLAFVENNGTLITSGKVTLVQNSVNGIPTGWTELHYADPAALAAKQDVLVSGTNIKTINNQSILGSGNITIEGGGSSEEIDYSKEYFTIESLVDNNTITFTPSDETNILEYSIDNKLTWIAEHEVNIHKGDKVLWRGLNLTCNSTAGCGTFRSTGNIKVSGNIMSLEFRSDFNRQTALTKEYQFAYLFKYDQPDVYSATIDASNLILPAITLTTGCYLGMFKNCYHLTKAPELPAYTLATSCYEEMFHGCGTLTKAPELPATTLAARCYANMFDTCGALTKAPELPATTLADSCYNQMFHFCGSLVEAPELPATTLVTNCYYEMFTFCSNLHYIKMLATDISASNCLSSWVWNVGTNGTLITSGKVTLPKNSNSGIPTGWTELKYADQAPDLSNYATNAQLQTVDNKVNAIDTNIDSIIDNLDNVTSTPTYTGTTTYSSVTEYQNDSTIFKFVKKNRWTVWNDCIYDYANTDYANYNAMIVIPVTFTDTNNMIKLSVESYASSNPVGSNHSLCVGYLTATGVSNVNSIDQSTTTGPSNTQNVPSNWYTVVNDLTSTLTPNGTWHIEETEIVPEYKTNNTAYVFILGRYVAIRNITIAQSVKPASFDKCIQSTTPGLKIEVVNALPATPVANTIYLVRDVQYNLTTATNVSELEPGQAAVIYYPHNIGTEITSASAGQIVDISVNYDIFNQDRPDYATEDVEGNWVFSNLEFDTEVEVIDNPMEGGIIVMPASDVHCIVQYTWTEDTPPEGGE